MDLVAWIWEGLGIFWLLAASRAKPTARRQDPATRLFQIAILMLAFVLLTGWGRIGILATRLVPDTRAIAIAGAILTAAGAALAVWARIQLGSNWSGWVTVKRDHELIRSGPYRVVRHPIYSGLLLAVAGTALATGEVRGLAALALAIAGFRWKAAIEERFMTGEFGDQYRQYRHAVKALIPFVL